MQFKVVVCVKKKRWGINIIRHLCILKINQKTSESQLWGLNWF